VEVRGWGGRRRNAFLLRSNPWSLAFRAPDRRQVKAVGRATGSTRTAEQTELARLWHAVFPADENATFNSLLRPGLELVDRARILALVNVSMEDAYIFVFDAKYTYNLWRPYHAIRMADTDGNPATHPDLDWTSLILPTPNHQEYPSAHSAISGAGLRMMSNLLGDNRSFTLRSPGYPSFVYNYPSSSAGALGVQNARIWEAFITDSQPRSARPAGPRSRTTSSQTLCSHVGTEAAATEQKRVVLAPCHCVGPRDSFVLVLFFVLRPSSSTSGASDPAHSERAQSARSHRFDAPSGHLPGWLRMDIAKLCW
jgi:hypothetical protein